MQFGRKKKTFCCLWCWSFARFACFFVGALKGHGNLHQLLPCYINCKEIFCPFLCTPMSRSHHKVEDHGRMILSCQPTGYKHETNINWPVSKHVDIIVDYRFHPPCHRPVKAETSPKAKPWLIGAATPPKAFVLHWSLWFTCSVGRIDVSLLPLGILAKKTPQNIGQCSWLCCLTNLFEVYVTHTTGSNYFTWCSCILFSWIFKMIFSLSLAWHAFLWFLPILEPTAVAKWDLFTQIRLCNL